MIGGIALETIYWYTLLICAGLAVLLIIFGDVFDFDGPLDPILVYIADLCRIGSPIDYFWRCIR
ncbi:hypothetical protein GHH84_11650, partial [Enterococcus faecium]|nr:hypothetical protein [Enterococcus faecium]